jgi:hypothetical protein
MIMKRSVLTLLCVAAILTFPFLSEAQRFTGGFSAGIIASQVDGDTYSGYNKAGISAGVWVKIASDEFHAFRIGMNYIQKGSRHNPDPEKEDYSQFLIRLGYVEMPFLYQYTLKNKIYIEGGLSLGVLLHSYMYQTDGYYYEPAYADDPFRLFDLCGQAGMGYHLTDKISVSLRGAYSLVSISKGSVNSISGIIYRGQYNHLVSFELSYRL